MRLTAKFVGPLTGALFFGITALLAPALVPMEALATSLAAGLLGALAVADLGG